MPPRPRLTLNKVFKTMPRATPEPTTAAAPAALPSLPPFPSIAEVGKRTVAISARYDALEEASLRLPDRLPSVVAEKTAMAQIDAERDALTELVCARCADSLEDAAVQAAFGFQLVDRTLACELEPTARDGTLEADLENAAELVRQHHRRHRKSRRTSTPTVSDGAI